MHRWMLMAAALLPAACAQPPQLARSIAGVESVRIEVTGRAPFAAQAVVRGYLADACTRPGAVEQSREGRRLKVILYVERPPEMMCAQVIRPFERHIDLDLRGLAPGYYEVWVNGVRARLEVPPPP